MILLPVVSNITAAINIHAFLCVLAEHSLASVFTAFCCLLDGEQFSSKIRQLQMIKLCVFFSEVVRIVFGVKFAAGHFKQGAGTVEGRHGGGCGSGASS